MGHICLFQTRYPIHRWILLQYFYRAFVPYRGFLVEFPMSGCPQSLLPHSAPYVSFCAAALNLGVPRQAPCVVNCTTCTPVHPLNILTHLLNCSLSSSKQRRAFFYSNPHCTIMCPSELFGASVHPNPKLHALIWRKKLLRNTLFFLAFWAPFSKSTDSEFSVVNTYGIAMYI